MSGTGVDNPSGDEVDCRASEEAGVETEPAADAEVGITLTDGAIGAGVGEGGADAGCAASDGARAVVELDRSGVVSGVVAGEDSVGTAGLFGDRLAWSPASGRLAVCRAIVRRCR